MLEGIFGRDNRIKKQLALLGILLVAAGYLPFVLMGEGSVVLAHDQLDGELLAYLLHAKYLGTGIQVFPEWLGGVSKTALTPPALLPILLFKVFSPFAAFICNQFIVALAAFLGMYFFLDKLIAGDSRWEQLMAGAVALCFAYLPFYSVYGLCVAGIPMLVYGIWILAEGRRLLLGFGIVVLYGLMSSFVLVGYAVLGLLWLYAALLLWLDVSGKRGWNKSHWPVYTAAAGLTFYYLMTNLDLVRQVFGKGETQISHKTELLVSGLDFSESFWSMLFRGSGHAASLHQWMVIPIFLILLLFFKRYSRVREKTGRNYRLLLGFFLSAVFIAFFYALFHGQSVVDLRNRMGGAAVFFQIDRIYWFYPFLWYTMLALSLQIIYDGAVMNPQEGQRAVKIRLTGILFTVLFLAVCAGNVLWQSDLKKNVRQLISPETSNAVTWEKFFAPPLFANIRDVIGVDQTQYRVGSIGLHPSVAAYNGFYTVDGYSNNYPLSYKHEFRKVIEKELAKNAKLKTYFDDWGNRCYLFSAELGMNYYIPNYLSKSITKLELDTEQLKTLGCEYLFSSVLIANAESMELKLMNIFQWDQSYYDIYVYEIN